MQRLQIARGEIKVRQNSLPLLAGEYFIDTTDGYQLYIGTGGSGNYEWASHDIMVEGQSEPVAGVNGAYKKIGTNNPVGFYDTHVSKDTPSYIVDSIPENPTTGSMYVISKDIQISSADAAASWENLVSDGDGESSTPEVKKGDVIIWTGYKWVKMNNAGGSAKESEFYNKYTQAPETSSASNVQDALVALDSQKLAYMGVLFDATNVKENDELSLKAGKNFAFETADGTSIVLKKGDDVYNAKYSNIEGTVWLINVPCTIEGVKYEQGDFVTFTASKLWSERVADADNNNARQLTAADVVVTHVPGGTHDPSKIYVEGSELERSIHGKHVYETSDKANIHNVLDALKVAFKTKADVDPDTGKILISQLPSTIIGAMEYQAVYDGLGTTANPITIDTGDLVDLNDGSEGKSYSGFVLPTADNKTSNENDADEETGADEPSKGLVKGDYWVFANATAAWDITQLVNDGKIISSGLKEVDGKFYINNGDWIVYNGDNTWSVLDNTDSFIGIKVGDDKVRGLAEITGTERNDTELPEVKVEIDEDNKIVLSSPNAVLTENGAAENVIYKSGSLEDKTAVASNLTDDGTHLTIDEDVGLKLVTTTGFEADADGNATPADVTAVISGNNKDVNLKLPNVSGTIASNEDLGIVDSDANGTDWFATMYRKEDGRKVIRDSFLKFLGTETNGSYALSGIQLVDETSSNHSVKIRLSSDTGTTVQVLPRTSGYLLNSNSVIDCGFWSSKYPNGTAPTEGYVSDEKGLFANNVTYDAQTEEVADADDSYSAEQISAIITND